MTITRPRCLRAGVVAALGLLLVGTLSGCGLESSLVGIQPPPVERVDDSAPLPGPAAQRVAQRVIGQAIDAEDDEVAAAALTGPAARLAEQRRERAPSRSAEDTLAPDEVTVLAMTSGRDWPRWMVATRFDTAAGRQMLYLLVSEDVRLPYLVHSVVPMSDGASVPSLGNLADGTSLVSDGDGLVAAPAEVASAYGAALAYPKPTKTEVVSTDDLMATSLKSNAAGQAKSLGELATLVQKHGVVEDSVVALRLADGGALAFALLKRTDTITLNEKAKEVTLPKAYATVAGKKTVTDKVVVTSLEPVAFVIPARGPASVVGAEDVLTGVDADPS